MSVPSTAERTFLTFLGVSMLVVCYFVALFTLYYVFTWPLVLSTGLAAVALLCRAADRPAWSPVLGFGTLPTVLVFLLVWAT